MTNARTGMRVKGIPCTLNAGFWIFAAPVAMFIAFFHWYADILWHDTGFVYGLAILVALRGLTWSSQSRLHPLFLRGNAAIGAARLGVIISVLWSIYVLRFHADPTLVGYWAWMYFVMAFAATKFFGQNLAQRFGPRFWLDVYERGNLAAGIFFGTFTLATGLIYGGAMWGELVPGALEYGAMFEVLPGYDDGWWITPWFFLMGWIVLVAALYIWIRRERGDFFDRIVRDRSLTDAKAAGYFCIANGITITYAVHGNYYGFWDSLLGFSIVALPILAHEVLRPKQAGESLSRDLEGLTYIAMSLIGIFVVPWLSTLLGLRI